MSSRAVSSSSSSQSLSQEGIVGPGEEVVRPKRYRENSSSSSSSSSAAPETDRLRSENEQLKKLLTELQDKVDTLAKQVQQAPLAAKGKYYRLICPHCREKTDVPAKDLTSKEDVGEYIDHSSTTAKCTECAQQIRLSGTLERNIKKERIFEIFKGS